jgi:hypothetical protein
MISANRMLLFYALLQDNNLTEPLYTWNDRNGGIDKYE